MSKRNVLSNPLSLDEAELNSFRSYLPNYSDDYWLSFKTSNDSISWRQYANASNLLENNSGIVTGKDHESFYENTEIFKGSYAFDRDFSLEDYPVGKGGLWYPTYRDVYSSESYINKIDTLKNSTRFRGFVTSPDAVFPSNPVFNMSNFKSVNGVPFVSARISEKDLGNFGNIIFGYVSPSDGRIIKVRSGDVIERGTTVMCCIYKERGYFDHYDYKEKFIAGEKVFVFFKVTENTLTMLYPTDIIENVRGVVNYSENEHNIIGSKITGEKKAVRPYFNLDSSKVSYVKAATSNSVPTISSTFTETPTSVAYSDDDKKLVIKSDDVSIGNSISNDKLTSERQDSEVDYRDNTIYVPYDSKTLSIKAEAFSTNNASHITALINQTGVKKYAVLSDTTSDINIDLNNILDTKIPGSNIVISFYAERINGENVSDEISETPVTINLEVAEGNEQTIKYILDGGSGAVPQSATIRAGKQYQLADGSGFSKETNKFSAWQMTYTPYGETEAKTRIVNSNETIVVPYTQDQTLTMTALYNGIKASKTTETKSSFITITWDTNAPDGVDDSGNAYTAKFDDLLEGTYNYDRTQRFDKVKIAGSALAIPEPPTNLSIKGYYFDGWYTERTGGTRVDQAVNPIINTTYYAHYSRSNSFLALAGLDLIANPLNIKGDFFDIKQISTEARDICREWREFSLLA